MDFKNTLLLAFFFRACPIILQTSHENNKPAVLGLGTNYVYVADFDNKGICTDEQVCRKGLWYVRNRCHYSFIGINDTVVDNSHKYGWGQVASRDRPDPFRQFSRKKGFMWPVRIAPVNPVWLNPYQDFFVYHRKLLRGSWIVRQEYDFTLLDIGRAWRDTGQLPGEVRELFEDPTEDRFKIMSMIGSQTYKVAGNKGIPQGIKDLAGKLREANREEREKGIPLLELERAVRETAEFLEDEFPAEEVETSVKAIATAAYEIRQGYPRKGSEVRHGLVHAQAYRKLRKLASENANPDIVDTIIDRHFYPYEGEYTDFKAALAKIGALKRKPLFSEDY